MAANDEPRHGETPNTAQLRASIPSGRTVLPAQAPGGARPARSGASALWITGAVIVAVIVALIAVS